MVTLPTSMDQCLYFTYRLDGKLKLKAWVYKKKCPKCGKALMGKPINPKTGRPKIRSTAYECSECHYEEEKVEHEESLEVEAIFTCPKCEAENEGTAPNKRKTYKGVKSYLVECSKCGEQIPITKKMKALKKKKGEKEEDE
ncbi:MAG: DNA-directed RNA polymerase subunit M/transcription elongation factor TFIIS [Candidatus Woesearchaeota archaeon]|jgi:DNA-directed RNA polymerase subunit M/transcription elongation factor TFIIS